MCNKTGYSLESSETASLAIAVLMPDYRCQTRSAAVCQFAQHTATAELILSATSSTDTAYVTWAQRDGMILFHLSAWAYLQLQSRLPSPTDSGKHGNGIN